MIDPEKAPLLEDEGINGAVGTLPVDSPGARKHVDTPSTSRRALYAMVALLLIKICIFAGLVGQRYWSAGQTLSPEDICLQPTPQGQPSHWSELYNRSGFAHESAERLAGAVKIPTQ